MVDRSWTCWAESDDVDLPVTQGAVKTVEGHPRVRQCRTVARPPSRCDETTLTIWAGAKGSPAFYRGEFSPDGRSNTGTWAYPDGGYQSSMTRKD